MPLVAATARFSLYWEAGLVVCYNLTQTVGKEEIGLGHVGCLLTIRTKKGGINGELLLVAGLSQLGLSHLYKTANHSPPLMPSALAAPEAMGLSCRYVTPRDPLPQPEL